MDYEKQSDRRNMGRPEQFYGETIHQPAFRIEIPVTGKNREEEKKSEFMVEFCRTNFVDLSAVRFYNNNI